MGKSFLQASVPALLPYFNKENLVKATLVFCGITYFSKGLPPASLVLSIVGVGVILVLGKIEGTWRQGQQEDQPLEGQKGREAGQPISNSHTTANKKQHHQLKKKK